MEKIDFKKELKHLYFAKAGQPTVVQVPEMNFLMIDGQGDPNTSQDYMYAIEALYSLAYTIKFICKAAGQDFGVMPLEGLWWMENMADFSTADKRDWLWRAMIMQPPAVTEEIFRHALEQVKEKKPVRALGKVRFEPYDEGRAAQVLHIGPYSDEGPTIEALHQFIAEQGGQLTESTKHHHEIYLGDPRRSAPEKLKTIIRQPF